MTKYFATFLLIPLLAACIVVNDFSPLWQRAQEDPCLVDTAKALDVNDPQEELIRWVKLNDTYSLMLIKEEAEAKGGNAYLYNVENNIITVFTPNKTRRADFEESYPDAPVQITEDKITLDILDDEALEFITKIAVQPDYWQTDKALLYNRRRVDACHQYIFTEDDE